ncbi:MAG: hypothetical protein ACLFO2_00700 [Candidatus Woesearchaeota archaeon]
MHIPKKSFSGYGRLLAESWQTLWRKPMAFLPTGYSFVGLLAISAILLGIAQVAYPSELTATQISSLIPLAVGGALLVLALIIHVGAMQMGVFRRIATGKDISFKESFKEANRRFIQMAGVILAGFVASLPLLIAVAGLFSATTWFLQQEFSMFVLFAVGFLALLILAGMIFYGAWFLFLLPLRTFERGSPWSVVGKAWRLLWNDARHVWLTYLINLGVSLGLTIALSVISAMLMVAAGTDKTPGAWQVIQTIINMVVSVWLLLFVFRSFVKRYQPKVA